MPLKCAFVASEIGLLPGVGKDAARRSWSSSLTEHICFQGMQVRGPKLSVMLLLSSYEHHHITLNSS